MKVERRGLSIFVMLENRPWGWPCMDREFIGRGTKLATQYAEMLRDRIRTAAIKGQTERERVERALWAEVRRQLAERAPR